jgi:hypothetical protein
VAPPGAMDTEAPLISGLSLSRKVFAVGRKPTPQTAARRRKPKRGTRFRFSLSEPAEVRIEISRVWPGRRAGGRCRKPARRNRGGRRCTRYVKVGALRRAGLPAGRRSVRFSGRIGRKPLRAARYRAELTATDASLNRSKPRRVRFKVVRRS